MPFYIERGNKYYEFVIYDSGDEALLNCFCGARSIGSLRAIRLTDRKDINLARNFCHTNKGDAYLEALLKTIYTENRDDPVRRSVTEAIILGDKVGGISKPIMDLFEPNIPRTVRWQRRNYTFVCSAPYRNPNSGHRVRVLTITRS